MMRKGSFRSTPLKILALVDLVLIVAVCYLGIQYKLHTSFFDRRIPPDSRPVINTVGFDDGGLPAMMSLTYVPEERARVLYILFNYTRPDCDYQALRLSSISDLPSAWIEHDEGFVKKLTPLPLSPEAKSFSPRIRWAGGHIRITIDEDPILDTTHPLRQSSVDLVFYPAFLVHTLRPPLTTVRDFRISTLHEDGGMHQSTMPSPLTKNTLTCLLTLAAALLVILLDFACRFLIRRIRHAGLSRALGSYPLLPMLLFLTLLVYSAVTTIAPSNWYGDLFKDGRFDADTFLKDPVLHLDDASVRISLDPGVIKVLAFGGSSTRGFPYRRGQWDWPAQLERILNSSTTFDDLRFQVVNLSFDGGVLETNLPDGIEPLFKTLRPAAVVLNTLINNHYSHLQGDLILHSLGFPRRQSENTPQELDRYLEHLEGVLDLCKRTGTVAMVIEASMDHYFFGGNPMAAWQEAMVKTSRDHGVVIVPLQKEFDTQNQRLIFYEFMHPTLLGYRLIGERVYEQMVLHRDRICNNPFQAP